MPNKFNSELIVQKTLYWKLQSKEKKFTNSFIYVGIYSNKQETLRVKLHFGDLNSSLNKNQVKSIPRKVDIDKSLLEVHKVPKVTLDQNIQKIKQKVNLSREKIQQNILLVNK